MKSSFLLRIIFFFIGSWLILLTLTPNFSVYAAEINIKELVKLTNQARIRQGLSPLAYNSILSTAALNKGNNMIAKKYWAHFGPNKQLDSPWYFIKRNGYIYQYAGENLAKGFNSALSTHNAWMNSPTHRQNIMNINYKDIGIAVLQGTLSPQEGQLFLVIQMFGTLSGQRSSVISESDLELGNWLNINRPSKNSVFMSKNLSITGSTSINNSTVNINIDKQNIANIGITDYNFDTTISNRFPNKELTIIASTKLSTGITLSDSTYIFNNLGNYLEKNSAKNLTATEKDGKLVLMVPSHQYIAGITLKSCNKDYSFTYQGDAYLLAIKNKQFQKINTCTQNNLVLQLLDGQSVQKEITQIKKIVLETTEKKALVQTYLGYTQQKNVRNQQANILWGLLLVIFILLMYVIITIYHYNFHYRRNFAISLLILLIVGAVKLVFSGGGIL